MFETPAPTQGIKALLGAVVFVLGAQSIRFFFGSLTWYLRDTVGVGVTDLIPIAVAPFLAGLILPIVSRWASIRGAMWIGLWVLVVSRILNQLAVDPAIELWTSAIAIAAFVGLLPLLLSAGRATLVGGVLLGLAVDSAIRGMGLSLDVAYQTGPAPIVIVVTLGIAAIWLFYAYPPVDRQGLSWAEATPLLGIAPFLFFQFLILQNQGWTSEVTGMGGPQAQLRIALLNVVALVAVTYLDQSRFVSLFGLAVFVGAVVTAEGGAVAFNVLSLLAIPGAALAWSAMVGDPGPRPIGVQSLVLTLGMTGFVAIGLAYYVPLDISVGYTLEQARLVSAALLGVFGLLGIFTLPPSRPGVPAQLWAFAAAATLLPLTGLLFAGTSAATPKEDGLRVMTYNIHSSFNPDGRFDIDAIAAVVESSNADIVGIQEIPRGRLISGVSDQVTLLQQRIGFEHVAFFGTTDPTWGNAIFSKYPISDIEKVYLPLVGTPMQRGYLGATARVGSRDLLFITTHLQHVNDRSEHDVDPERDLYPVHTEQVGTILDAWDGREPAILVGDFNARPGWLQIDELTAAGWVDVWPEAGSGDGFTAPSPDPRYRIDYIFHTEDQRATDAGVFQSQASDHFAVVADIGFLEG